LVREELSYASGGGGTRTHKKENKSVSLGGENTTGNNGEEVRGGKRPTEKSAGNMYTKKEGGSLDPDTGQTEILCKKGGGLCNGGEEPKVRGRIGGG